jgi:hypothetical protein
MKYSTWNSHLFRSNDLPLGMGKWCFGPKTFDLTGLKLEFPNFNSQNPLLLLFFFFYVGMEGQVC